MVKKPYPRGKLPQNNPVGSKNFGHETNVVKSNLAVSGHPMREPVDRGLHSSTNRSSRCSKFAAPAIGLSGAVCELVRTLTFGTLAAGIGTIIPATTTVRPWIRQYPTAHYTAPLPIAALTFGNMPFPLSLLGSVAIIARTGISSSDSDSSYHRSAWVS
jgi:hypothetical protein